MLQTNGLEHVWPDPPATESHRKEKKRKKGHKRRRHESSEDAVNEDWQTPERVSIAFGDGRRKVFVSELPALLAGHGLVVWSRWCLQKLLSE